MFGKRGIFPLIIIIASLVLFVLSLVFWKDENEPGRLYSMLSNILLIVGMVFVMIGNRNGYK